MPEIGSAAWIDAFNAAVADVDAEDAEITVLHRIDGGPAWLVVACEGTVGVDSADGDDEADLVFTWQRDDAEAVARGDVGPLEPFQSGRLRIAGDLTKLTDVSDLFARFPAVPTD
jgi:putative sterol carrier protein